MRIMRFFHLREFVTFSKEYFVLITQIRGVIMALFLLIVAGGLVLKGKTEAIDAFEPITAEEAETDLMQRYGKAFALLDEESPEAEAAFRKLREEFPEDPLVNLHCGRMDEGIFSTTIVLAEK